MEHYAIDIVRPSRPTSRQPEHRSGLGPSDAAAFAATLIASSEGAVALSRAELSPEPFDLVAEQLLGQIRSLPMSTPTGE